MKEKVRLGCVGLGRRGTSLLKNCITKIVDGVAELSKHDVGALIVFEREVKQKKSKK